MRLARLLAAAVLGLGLAATGAIAKEWKKVRIGTEGAYEPFNFYDSKKNLVGFDVDIAKALCERMKVSCEFVAQDWDGIIPALLAKKYDAIVASMSMTDERKKQVAFTDKYYNTPARFIVRKDGPLQDTTPEALKGKNAGAQSATIHANYLEEQYKPKGVNVKLYGKQDEANADLASGRLDAILADSVILFEWLKTKEGQCCKFLGPDYKDPKYFGEGAGIAIRKEDADLKEMLNKALAEIIKDGTYKKINEKYFPFAIY